MWSVDTTQLDSRTRKSFIRWNGLPLPARRAYELCVSSGPFRQSLIDELGAAPFDAYFWETPPLTTGTAERFFEYVITDAPRLAMVSPEVQAFGEHFGKDVTGEGIVTFENLGRDAMLVVPCPLTDHKHYSHIGGFIRSAPPLQVHALLRSLGQAVLDRLSARPIWVSTAGMGVYWLHVRLDSTPKYYRHVAYTNG